jgi:hypothetical protein
VDIIFCFIAIEDYYMQVIVQLDAESTHQLAAIQDRTNQDRETVIKQAISLYYQQIQPHCHLRAEHVERYELVSNGTANLSAIN